MIIDINANIGHWPFHPLRGDVKSVCDALSACGVEAAFISPLEAVWSRGPHLFNNTLVSAADASAGLWPVPVLDPAIATWPQELESLARHPRIRLVKLFPAYSPYPLEAADEMLSALAERGLGVIVQTRLEDPRRQHPLAQVPDIPAAQVAEAASRHPSLKVVIGGPRAAEIRSLKEPLRALPNLYADVSQADGMEQIRLMVSDGLTEKLLFGSHCPFFIPSSGLARIVLDLDDTSAEAILGGNARRMLGI